MSTRDERYQEFWQGFSDYMANRNGPVAPPVVSDLHYVKFPPILRGFKLCAAFDKRGRKRKVELLVRGEGSEAYAQQLRSQRADIEAEVGQSLDWNIGLKVEKKISLWDCGVDVFAGLPTDHYAWYADKLELLHRVFAPRTRAMS